MGTLGGRGTRAAPFRCRNLSGFSRSKLHAIPLPTSLGSATFPPGEGIDRCVDRLAYSRKLPQNFKVCKTQNPESLRFQISRSDAIFFCFFRFIVLRAIQFNYQFYSMAVEIYDIISDYILSAKTLLIFAQKTIPQKRLFLGHILTQRL